MWGYCQDCALEVYGEDTGDFAGFVAVPLAAEGYGMIAECRACGPVVVDPDGRRATLIVHDA